MITLSPDIGYALCQLMRFSKMTRIFHPIWGDGKYLEAFNTNNLYQTAVCQDREKLRGFFPDSEIDDKQVVSFHDRHRRVEVNSRVELFKPMEQFHYGFAFNNFSLTRDNGLRIVSPAVEDSMLYFESSKSTLSSDRITSEHLLTMEQMYNACMVGGYFAAVVPRRWAGSNMKYAKWWNDTAATVARITLPAAAIQYSEDELDQAEATLEQVQADNNLKWELVIWMKPSPRRMQRHKLLHAEFRYATFLYKMQELGNTEAQKVREAAAIVKSFRKHDWWHKSVKLWLEMLEINSTSLGYGTVDSGPVELQDPSTTRIFKPTAATRPTYKIAESIAEIEADPYGIHIKPGPPVRVRPYNPIAASMWHDLEAASEPIQIPATDHKPPKVIWTASESLRRKHFSNCKEELVKSITQKGLVPYILRSDLDRLKKQNKWLAIQLTPIERCVKTQVVDPDDDSKKRTEWDWMYSDIGLRATHPELWKMWETRARKMKLDKFEFGFQFIDNITMACHWSVLNANVMGLGKTLQLLVNQLLLGTKHGLYVVPSKLIGVWQDEIEGNISRYVSMAKRHWTGARMYADYQIIEWGAQCLPSKLSTFNLISYEKLGSIPRDTLFFKCDKCDFVAASVRRHEAQPCPNPQCVNFGRTKRAKEINRIRGLQKRKVRTAEGVKEIDERVWPGPLYMMKQLEHREKRISTVLRGTETSEIPDPTDPAGVRKIPVVIPIYEEEEKSVHLKWTFSGLLRNMFNYVAVDEAVNVKNPDALRTKALKHLTPRHRVLATGTPVRGYQQSVLSLLNFAFKRSIFSDYRHEDRGAESRFLEKYGTKVLNQETGKWKLIPKANNPEQLQAELAPLMLRHIREEPGVAKDVPPKKSIRELIPLHMDDMHREFYQKWLDKFIEWWKEKKKEEGKRAASGELIVKMGYLRNASSIPHAMFDALTSKKGKKSGDSDAEGAAWAAIIGPYKGPPTQKQLWTRKLIMAIKQGGTIDLPSGAGEMYDAADHADLGLEEKRTLEFMGGQKAIAFSLRRANLIAGQAWAASQKKPPVYSMVVDGRVSNAIQASTGKSRKHDMIQQFCDLDYDVMWAGLLALAEGHNIPCANHGIMMDYSWEPSDHRQGVGRMLRPQQQHVVYEYYPSHIGTIDDYMAALCILKGRSMDEVVDYMEFEDFGVKLIPDIKQYAQSIVDGTHKTKRAEMWLAAEEILRKEREGDYDED